MKDGAIVKTRLSLSDVFTCFGADESLLEWFYSYAQGIYKPMPLLSGTPFQRDVLEKMKQIPLGQTMTYGELALACGRPRAARAVGGACKHNPFPLLIPCHRVIQSNGRLGGFAYGLEIKKRLLEFEAGCFLPQ